MHLHICVCENMFLCICEEGICVCALVVSVAACSRVNECVLSVLVCK